MWTVTLQVVLSVWAVSDEEAITVSVYDHKAVQNLEITLLCGWWAELGITGLKSMAPAGLSGLAGKAEIVTERFDTHTTQHRECLTFSCYSGTPLAQS